jgi:DNA-binding PadR family transcriptional regulator
MEAFSGFLWLENRVSEQFRLYPRTGTRPAAQAQPLKAEKDCAFPGFDISIFQIYRNCIGKDFMHEQSEQREHWGRHWGRWGGERGFFGGRHGHGDDQEGRGEWRGRGGRGFGRPFDHGELRLVILMLVAEKPRHGYEIIKAIEDRFGGSYSPSPGVVYPTLTMLEELGHATVEESGGKKLYTVTEQGRAYLGANRQAAEAAMGRMQPQEETPASAHQLFRAMGNLKMALRLRYRSGPLSDEQLKTVISALDAAAAAIERS